MIIFYFCRFDHQRKGFNLLKKKKKNSLYTFNLEAKFHLTRILVSKSSQRSFTKSVLFTEGKDQR